MKTSNKLLLGLLALILLITTAFIGAAKYYSKSSFVAESGQIVTEKRPVQTFTKLYVQGNIKVILTPNAPSSLELKGDKNYLKNIQTTIENGELVIKVPFKTKSHQTIEARVSSASFESLDFSAGSSLEGAGVLTSKKLSLIFSTGSQAKMAITCEETILDCSTGAVLNIKGSTGYFRINSSTGAVVDAANLIAAKGNIVGSTGSVMEVNITEEVEAALSTGSVVKNSGNAVSKNMALSTGGTFTKKQ